ncbi:MAG: molecular chaperone HtpG, partial [Verrucomicrobiales bacterium]
LLDIVINSLYTDKEIFVRELVSNASDSLEKLRHLQLTEKSIFEPKQDLEIRIDLDEEAKTITITDTGIGMTREELQENLGTIAHSGSKKFFEAMSDDKKKEASLIGQFGVGFYSAFMVSDEVEVYTHSWREDAESLKWSSDGKTGYEIEDVDPQPRGAKMVIKLKEGQEEYATKPRVQALLERYSNFVPFPILLDGERVNKVEALWLKNKKEVSDEEYEDFYKFTAHAYDAPRLTMHFSADAPISINALLFVPQENPERAGMGQVDPGVALYCKKVLIDAEPKGLLPEWLRFLKGVIDSADLPLNISRETMQDSALVQKLNRLITKRFIKFLEGLAKSEEEQYAEFYERFNRFIKEGVAMDMTHKDQLTKLLRYDSSMADDGKLTGLVDYLARAKEGQEEIYYLLAPNREAVDNGPYIEAFKARGLEVLYMYDGIDEYVIGSIPEFEGKKLVPIDRADLELEEMPDEPEVEGEEKLEKEKSTELCTWLKAHLGDKVGEVKESTRLVDSPAMATSPQDAMSPQMRQMMMQMNPDGELDAPKVTLEVNAKHPLIKKLAEARESKPEFADLIAAQIFDNAMIAAGLLEDGKDMVARMYKIMEDAL